MTTQPTKRGHLARHALLAIVSATVLCACGGGDPDAEEFDAAAETSLGDPVASSALEFEKNSAQATRAPLGGGRRVPICTHAPPACPSTVPPTQ